MNQLLACLVICAWFSLACNQLRPPERATTSHADTADFYQVNGFFNSQLAYARALQKTGYCISIRNGKKDSVLLTRESFNAWAGIFLEKNISDPAIKAKYRETVFEDLSTQSYTLNYSAMDPALPVQSMDVLLDDATNQVKRVFIRSHYTRGDTSITEQCSWKAFKSFQINQHVTTPDGYNLTAYHFINWNDNNPSLQ